MAFVSTIYLDLTLIIVIDTRTFQHLFATLHRKGKIVTIAIMLSEIGRYPLSSVASLSKCENNRDSVADFRVRTKILRRLFVYLPQ